MNRDETIARGPEMAPVLREDDAVAWMAPCDSDRGGTWMGANEYGVVACLLNAYRQGESLLPDPSSALRTRGEIIPHLLAKGPIEDACNWMNSDFDATQYPSFSLFVLSPRSACCFTWYHGGDLQRKPLSPGWCVSSSCGWDSAEVIRYREAAFDDWRNEGCAMVGDVPAFNLFQAEGEEDKAPLMRREWSTTRSITQVQVNPSTQKIDMRSWPEPVPQGSQPATHLTLNLHATAEVRGTDN